MIINYFLIEEVFKVLNKKKILTVFLILVFCTTLLTLNNKTKSNSFNVENLNLNNLQWIKTGGPIGGMGYDIRIHPVNHDILYVTDVWGGVHKSIDGGKKWVQKNNGITTRTGPSGDAIPVFCLTINQKNPNLMWCGLQGFKAIYKSTDGGEHWVEKSNGIPNIPGITFRSFTFDPYNSDIVYAGCEVPNYNFQPTNEKLNESTGKIFKTTDGGEHWIEILDSKALVRWILIDPRDTNVIYAATGIFDRGSKEDEGIWKSTDGGRSWFHINNGLDDLTVGGLDMDPNNPDILYCSTGRYWGFGPKKDNIGRVYKTVDGGKTWKLILSVNHQSINLVNVSPSNPNILYAAYFDHWFKSEDKGKTWRLSKLAPFNYVSGIPISIAINPKNSDVVYVNSYNGGIFKTMNGGVTWINSSKGYTGAQIYDISLSNDAPSKVYTSGRSGVFKETNWTNSTSLVNRMSGAGEWSSIIVNPYDSKEILCSSRHWGMIFKSSNFGKNWKMVTKYIGDERLYKSGGIIDVHGVSKFIWPEKKVVYACFKRGFNEELFNQFEEIPVSIGVYKSVDSGETWFPINKGLESTNKNVFDIVNDPKDPEKLYIIIPYEGLFKSNNGGKSWFRISDDLRSFFLRTIAINPTNPDVLYIGTNNSGIFKSTDGGKNWRKVTRGMDQEASIRSICIDPIDSNIIYAADWRTGVYISLNGGKTWKPINKGLTTRAVNKLQITHDGNVLYAATEGEGIFILPLRKTKDIYLFTESYNHKVSLYWSPFPGDKYLKYRIYKSIKKDEGYKLITELNEETLEYEDYEVENDNEYFYKVEGVDNKGDSYLSEIIEGKPRYIGPIIDGNLDKYEWPEVYLYKDPRGDNKFEDIDIKEVFGFTFNRYLYFMIKFYTFFKDAKNSIFTIQIDLNSDRHSDYSGGFSEYLIGMDISGLNNVIENTFIEHFDEAYIIKQDVLEVMIPLSWIEDKENPKLKCFLSLEDGDQIDSIPWVQLEPFEKTIWNIAPPSQPKNLEVFQIKEKIKLTWSSSTPGTYDVSGYEIFRGESEKNLVVISRTIKESTVYFDKDITYKKTYYYKVRAFDTEGNYSGFSNVVSITVEDITPPSITITSPQDNSYINKDTITVKGLASDSLSGVDKLIINGEEVSIKENGEFEKEITLSEGENKIKIEAYDKAGNKQEKTLTLFLDKTPPTINTYIPDEIYEPSLTITGSVQDNLSGINFLRINGEDITISSNGSFSHTLTLYEGENTITFELEDKAGNKTRETFTVSYIKKVKRIILKLQIGNKIMLVNSEPVEIDVPPTIVEGRTLLPIRWVAEPLGADVGWDGKERKVTVSLNDTTIELWIGKSTARVNGVEKPIDPNNPKVVPMIINGRTMLPVRFVAENLGCRVEWNSITKTVTIIYEIKE